MRTPASVPEASVPVVIVVPPPAVVPADIQDAVTISIPVVPTGRVVIVARRRRAIFIEFFVRTAGK
jgi:hypothetical protein